MADCFKLRKLAVQSRPKPLRIGAYGLNGDALKKQGSYFANAATVTFRWGTKDQPPVQST
jgi:hypothetical protein